MKLNDSLQMASFYASALSFRRLDLSWGNVVVRWSCWSWWVTKCPNTSMGSWTWKKCKASKLIWMRGSSDHTSSAFPGKWDLSKTSLLTWKYMSYTSLSRLTQFIIVLFRKYNDEMGSGQFKDDANVPELQRRIQRLFARAATALKPKRVGAVGDGGEGFRGFVLNHKTSWTNGS